MWAPTDYDLPQFKAQFVAKYEAVDVIDLLISTLKVLFLPVLVGAFLNQYFQSLVKFGMQTWKTMLVICMRW